MITSRPREFSHMHKVSYPLNDIRKLLNWSINSHELREWRLTFAGHCYRCEDQLVKHPVLWARAGRMLRGQANRMMYVKQLLRDSCCETVDELLRKMNDRAEWARVLHTASSSEWLRSLCKWMDGTPVKTPSHCAQCTVLTQNCVKIRQIVLKTK